MEPKRSKYDTNPLDDDFADRADDSFGSSRPGQPTDKVFGGPTHEIGAAGDDTVQAYSESEAPTRHINDKFTAYPSIFAPPKPPEPVTYQPPPLAPVNVYQPPPGPVPGIYQPPPSPLLEKPGRRKVCGLGIPERWAVMLPYLPFWLAIVASVIELLLAPRTESRVRFHAAQGIMLQVVITAVSTMLTLVGMISGRYTGVSVFNFATFIFLIVCMVRVFKGKSLVIPLIDEPRKWLDEKIKPRK